MRIWKQFAVVLAVAAWFAWPEVILTDPWSWWLPFNLGLGIGIVGTSHVLLHQLTKAIRDEVERLGPRQEANRNEVADAP